MACACAMAFAATMRRVDTLHSMLRPGVAPIHNLPPNGSTEQLRVHTNPQHARKTASPSFSSVHLCSLNSVTLLPGGSACTAQHSMA